MGVCVLCWHELLPDCVVVLSHATAQRAGRLGVRRHTARPGQRDAHGLEQGADIGIVHHVRGAIGEAAWAGVRGHRLLETINEYHHAGGDQRSGTEVKCRSGKYYDAIVRDKDVRTRPHTRVALFSSHLLTEWMLRRLLTDAPARLWPVRFLGTFIMGNVRTHPEWRHRYGDREEAWFVPQAALKPPRRERFPMWVA